MQLIRAAFGLAAALAVSGAAYAQPTEAQLAARVDRVLARTPLIDGHNDLPWQVRARFDGRLDRLDLAADTAGLPLPKAYAVPLMTDIPRLRAGRVGGQFWSVFVPATYTGATAVQTTLEQIDLVKGLAARYPRDFETAYSAADVVRIHKAGKIASLIGMEGGSQIGESLPALRQLYAAGARYLTLTHSVNVRWADSATADPQHNGLTPFGKAVVVEMNRLGMLVDLSHVSEKTMRDAMEVSQAPVIFSHSGSRAVADHPRNVSDEVLRLTARNRGVVMVNFSVAYASDARRRWVADRAAEQARFNAPPYGGLFIGEPEKAKAAMARWDAAHPTPPVTLSMIADHVEHIAEVCGHDCVGIGSDFDGVAETPQGLESVDRYPALFIELARRGWSDADLSKLAGGNVLRVMGEAEAVATRLQATTQPSYATIADLDGGKP